MLGDSLLPSRLPRGMRLLDAGEEVGRGSGCRSWANYEFDDLAVLGAPHGLFYGVRGRRPGPWDTEHESSLIFRFLRFECRSYNCFFWYTLYPEEEEARLAGAEDHKALRRNLAKRLRRVRISLRIRGPGKLVESNGRRISETESFWEGNVSDFLEREEGTNFSGIGIFAARYYISPPRTFWLAELALLVIVVSGMVFWRHLRRETVGDRQRG
jgi:hypothetical protein